MTRRGIIRSLVGLTIVGWAGFKIKTRRVERLAIDPDGQRYAYHDGWIVRK